MARRPKEIVDAVQNLLLQSSNLNGESYRAGLPLLFELRSKIENLQSLIKSLKLYDKLATEKLCDYCESHKSALDETLVQEKDDQWAGVIVIDGTKYRYCRTKAGYVRNDGSNLTQAFLKALPATWTKTKLELDTQAINKQAPSDEMLENEGLERGTKREWSIVE